MQPTAATSPTLKFFTAPQRQLRGRHLVSRHYRISGVRPFVAGRMQVGVADAAIKNFDLDICRSGFATFKRKRTKRRCG